MRDGPTAEVLPGAVPAVGVGGGAVDVSGVLLHPGGADGAAVRLEPSTDGSPAPAHPVGKVPTSTINTAATAARVSRPRTGGRAAVSTAW